MTLTPRRRRMALVGLIVLGVGAAAAFALTAFQDNLLYYYPPSDVVAGKAPGDRVFRLGGMVPKKAASSAKRAAWKRASSSPISQQDVTVSYSGVLPDLFRAGPGRDRARRARPGRRVRRTTKCSPSTMRTTCRPKWRRALRKQHEKRHRVHAVDIGCRRISST